MKVTLAGTGGDEMLGGYPWRYPSLHMSPDVFHEWHFAIWQRLLDDDQLQRFMAPHADDLSDFNVREICRSVFRRTPSKQDLLSQALYFEAKTFLQGLLAVEDRLSMAHGLEVRVPFLDNDVVDFCQRLPRALRVDGNSPSHGVGSVRTTAGKRILRRALSGLLPEPTLEAPKQGFAGPDSQWFSGALRHHIDASVRTLSPRSADAGELNGLACGGKVPISKARLIQWSLIATSLHLKDYGLATDPVE